MKSIIQIENSEPVTFSCFIKVAGIIIQCMREENIVIDNTKFSRIIGREDTGCR